jgi:hypothetical protein
MRGSVYPWHGRKVIPTFHPAAILRGGGEKSRQFADLEEDFALIKRTLTEPSPPPPVVSLIRHEEDAAPTPSDDQLELF